MTIQYDGGAYGGWQRLGGGAEKKSIQGRIEEALSALLKEDIHISGAGRTDAGVHALGQRANFHTRSPMPGGEIMERTNRGLPEDIRITAVMLVPNRFHSRYDAAFKTYEYHIEQGERPGVFQKNHAAHVPELCDVERMRHFAGKLIGTHDFKEYSAAMRGERNTVRTITDITILKKGNHITIKITGNGFLYHMVRLIAGALVEEGLPEQAVRSSGRLMPAKGLFLKEVDYQGKDAVNERP